MSWKHLFERKTLEMLHAELADERRLHRVLGPVSLTSLGVGAIIGAGIFAMTGRVAANDAGPAVIMSYAMAGVACVFAALCYAEFAAMAPVAGSAYTYTYATLGELWAWIIGWDLILEYSMACAVVAAHWTGYLNQALKTFTGGWELPAVLSSDPFTKVIVGDQAIQSFVNLPAMLIMALVTYVLVIGIRQSAATNTVLVLVKVGVVLFVIGLGCAYVNRDNWTTVPVDQRKDVDVSDYLERHPEIAAALVAERREAAEVKKAEAEQRKSSNLTASAESSAAEAYEMELEKRKPKHFTNGKALLENHPRFKASLTSADQARVEELRSEANRWGLLAPLGVKSWLVPIDQSVRSPFLPYGISGMMIGASLVFFAFVGFDSISTHAEEAVRPQRDVPFAILTSLIVCTILYMLVSGVITGMEPYPQIDSKAAVAVAFSKRAAAINSPLLNWSSGLIALGALAGMTSVILVTFLSQARVFLAMARDGLLPRGIFGVVHEKFRTPHRSTMLTGFLIVIVSGFFPIRRLEEMVNIGTLLAFVMVCGAVLILRIRHPEAHRPFRCPAVYLVAPLGILVNLMLMLFLPLDTWVRLVAWLGIGLLIYLAYGRHHSVLRTVVRARATP